SVGSRLRPRSRRPKRNRPSISRAGTVRSTGCCALLRPHGLANANDVHTSGFETPRESLSAAPWALEPTGVIALMDKIRGAGVPLREFTEGIPLSGIKTGFNEAFLIDTPTKDRLVAADPKSAALFKPYLRGQDINRWQAEWTGLWMLAMKSSGNHAWPWS